MYTCIQFHCMLHKKSSHCIRRLLINLIAIGLNAHWLACHFHLFRCMYTTGLAWKKGARPRWRKHKSICMKSTTDYSTGFAMKSLLSSAITLVLFSLIQLPSVKKYSSKRSSCVYACQWYECMDELLILSKNRHIISFLSHTPGVEHRAGNLRVIVNIKIGILSMYYI